MGEAHAVGDASGVWGRSMGVVWAPGATLFLCEGILEEKLSECV